MFVERGATKALVERNIAKRVPLTHALQLSRIEDAEGQREVYAKVTKAFPHPTAQNFEAMVVRWLDDHEQSTRQPGQRGGAWVASDLEEDEELAKALDKIQEVYGAKDRKAFQDGTIGWTRKDIVGLAKFPASKMKEIHYLIMEQHWGLEKCFKFVNDQPDDKTKVGDLINHMLGTVALRYVCSVRGVDITVEACPALARKIKESTQQVSVKASVKPRVMSTTELAAIMGSHS